MEFTRDILKVKCVECGRVFDMLNDIDVDEWSFGHDCEILGVKK